MKDIEFPNGGIYASKWGLTDFYDGNDDVLRKAVESGEDFDTGWFGCKAVCADGTVYPAVELNAADDTVYVEGYILY